MRFTHIDINFDVRYEGHQNCPKILSMNILRVFSDHHLWHQNWRQYQWTSLYQFNFFVNLLHSLGVWIFNIWHLFDNLASFWQLDIFLTFWHITWIISAHHWLGVKVGSRGTDDLVCPIPLYPSPMWPICPVPHCPICPYPFTPYPLYPIAPCGPHSLHPLPMCPVPHTPVPYCPICPYYPYPCTPYPLYPTAICVPIAHMAHTPCTLLCHMPHCPCGPHTPCTNCPCSPYPIPPVPIPLLCYCSMCPIAYVPHDPCPPLGNGPHG